MSKSSKSIIFLVLKTKRREIIADVFQKIKIVSQLNYHNKRNSRRNALRKIIEFMNKNKRIAFDNIFTSRAII